MTRIRRLISRLRRRLGWRTSDQPCPRCRRRDRLTLLGLTASAGLLLLLAATYYFFT